MRPFYHKVNIDGMWICQFVELLIIRHPIKEIESRALDILQQMQVFALQVKQ